MTDPGGLRFALLPDSLESRLLTDLTSHATDLSEAAQALRFAREAREVSPLWMPLTMHAATAYIRPFIHSNVRTRLDQMRDFPGIPEELRSVHDTIRIYRNTTVAHSQSDLVLPLALAILDAHGLVTQVQGHAVMQQMPGVLAERFEELIDTMETLVSEATQPVVDQLREQHRHTDTDTVSSWPGPDITYAQDTDFTATRKRSRNPRFTFYAHTKSHSHFLESRDGASASGDATRRHVQADR